MRVIWINTDGEILQIGYTFPGGLPDQGLQADGTYILCAQDLGGLDDHEFIELRYWDGQNIQERSARPSEFYFWFNSQWNFNENLYLEKVRLDRQRLLYRTDWTQLVDAPLTEAQRQDSIEYRQALRDMTNPIIADPQAYTTIESAPWPTPPSFLNVS